MLASKLLSACGEDKLYVDDVFSTYLYTGNGSTQTITNGIDLAGKGGLVWQKSRNTVNSFTHRLSDTERGAGNTLRSDSTAGSAATGGTSSFTSSGFTLTAGESNEATDKYVAWTFRKAPKFFDCGTYTGNGVAGRQIPHSLGVAPGMVIVKCTSTTGSWITYHRSAGVDGAYPKYLILEQTANAYTGSASLWNAIPTDSYFQIGSNSNINSSGATYVWYAFAHDTSTDGIIQCGSFTTDASGNTTVSLGWEPQYLMWKASSTTNNWNIVDSMRGFTDSAMTRLFANLSNAEGVSAGKYVTPTATGFTINSLEASATQVYLAIRRPNKPPTTGTQVYNAITRTGTGAAATVTGAGFAPDLSFTKILTSSYGTQVFDRLRGQSRLQAHDTGPEYADAQYPSFDAMDGFRLGTSALTNGSGSNFINHFFKRAVGVFDVVCYTGDDSGSRGVIHNLSVAPELVIVKGRSGTPTDPAWLVWDTSCGTTHHLFLNLTSSKTTSLNSSYVGSGVQTANTFSVGAYFNTSNINWVAYLFATKSGISKVGSYTGNGSSQTIDCGFTTGARFVLIKRTDSTGDWYVWDSARGIVAGNDPHLSLNTTAAEVTTDDSVDADSTGFVVNQVAATNVNVNAATYIYLAYA